MVQIAASVYGSSVVSPEERDYISLVSEVDYVINAIEKSLDRLSFARSASPINNLLLSLSIAGVGSAFLVSSSEVSISHLFISPPGVIIAVVVYASFGIYSLSFLRARLEARRRARIVGLQLKLAQETLMNLKSWIDRADMTFSVKKMLDLRSFYLEALIIEARDSTDVRGLID